MDPLSITASIIAIVGVGGQAAKAVRRLASLKGAPDCILAMNNEITDLNLVVLAIQEIYQKQRTSTIRNQAHNINFDDSVRSALDQTNQMVTELQTLYDRLNQSSIGTGSSTSFHKKSWLLEQKKMKKLQEGLRNARLKLSAALGILNSSALIHVETSVHGLYQQISNLQTDQQQSYTALDQSSIKQNTDVQRSITRVLDAQHRVQLKLDLIEADNIARAAESATGAATMATDTGPVGSGVANRPVNSTIPTSIVMTARLHRFQCMVGCTCSCHNRKTMKLRLLDRFFGSLFIGYMGLPYITSKYDDRFCTQRAFPLVLTTYIFPSWLLAHALSITFKFVPHAGPEFNLRVAPVVDASSALFAASARGDLEDVKALLRQGIGSPYDMHVSNGFTPLIRFVKSCFMLAQILFKEDFAQRNAVDELWRQSLGSKHMSTEMEGIRSLFQTTDIPETWNLNLVQKTVFKLNTFDLATVLNSVSRREINGRDTNGRTALFWAVCRNDAPSVSMLIDHGADVDMTDSEGKAPIGAAIQTRSEVCARLLLDSGADTNWVDTSDWHLIHHYCFYGAFFALEAILLGGTDIDAGIVGDGGTALSLAAQNSHTQNCHFLISRNADLNKADYLGETPLFLSIWGCHPESLRLLLEYKANRRLKTKAGESLLHYAAQHGDIECLEVLRSFELEGFCLEDRVTGQSPTQRSKVVGLTALEIVEQRKDVSPDWLEAFRRLIRSVEIANARSLAGAFPTMEVEESEDFEDARELQDREYQPNAARQSNTGPLPQLGSPTVAGLPPTAGQQPLVNTKPIRPRSRTF